MIHKLFFIGGLILLFAAVILHHKRHTFMMHCIHHKVSPQKKSEFVIKHISKKLGLSDPQKVKLREIRNDIMTKHDSLYSERENMFKIVISEIEKETLDQSRLNQLFQQKLEKVSEIHPYVLSKLAEFHGTLTQEQKQKLTAFMQKHHGTGCH
ncbi:Spy/CpxP family protein refolding chaperone [bacterium]